MRARRAQVRLVLASGLAALAAGCGDKSGAPQAPAVAASAASAAANEASALAAYLRGAEIQAETDAQRRELRRALADLAEKPVAELRAARYAGPAGEPGQRDLVQVLRAHLLPGSPQALDAQALFEDAAQPDARAALRDKLAEIDRSLATTAASAAAK